MPNSPMDSAFLLLTVLAMLGDAPPRQGQRWKNLRPKMVQIVRWNGTEGVRRLTGDLAELEAATVAVSAPAPLPP